MSKGFKVGASSGLAAAREEQAYVSGVSSAFQRRLFTVALASPWLGEMGRALLHVYWAQPREL